MAAKNAQEKTIPTVLTPNAGNEYCTCMDYYSKSYRDIEGLQRCESCGKLKKSQ
jgi:hypothetical protein